MTWFHFYLAFLNWQMHRGGEQSGCEGERADVAIDKHCVDPLDDQDVIFHDGTNVSQSCRAPEDVATKRNLANSTQGLSVAFLKTNGNTITSKVLFKRTERVLHTTRMIKTKKTEKASVCEDAEQKQFALYSRWDCKLA